MWVTAGFLDQNLPSEPTMGAPYSPGPDVRSGNSICFILSTGLVSWPPRSPPAPTLDGEGSRILHTRAAEADQRSAIPVLDGLQGESVLRAIVLHTVPQGSRLHLALRLSALEFFPVKEPGALDDGGESEGENSIFPVVYLHVLQTCHQARCGY